MPRTTFARLVLFAAVLALSVVVLGAYVRLSHAGLGCPDWPGCYGRLDVPDEPHLIASANAAFPDRPVEVAKAWKEMVHRYLASGLGLVIVVLAALAWRRRQVPGQARVLPLALVALVVFQGVLGMWTVTLLLKPLVVTSHLLFGLTTLALLWWLALRHAPLVPTLSPAGSWRGWGLLALLLLVGQIALGGWTSTNYAALACPELPTCQGQWWPATDFSTAYTLWHGLGRSYEGGVLDNAARVTIHLTHRLGAIVVGGVIGVLAWRLLRAAERPLRVLGGVLATLLATQISLGLANVALHLPLPVAVAHNAGAAALLLALVTLQHMLRPKDVT